MTWDRSDKISAGALCVALTALVLQAIPTIQDKFFPDENCDDPGELVAVTLQGASASSEHAPESSFDYSAERVIDGDLNTAWIPAGGNGGVGSQLLLTLPDPENVQMLCAVNGYAKDESTYDVNGRVRDLAVATDPGESTGALKNLVASERGTYQELPLRTGQTDSITITITTYYAGVYTGAQDSYDTAVSEVIVYAER